MSLKQIIDMLVNTVDRGGNMLLNVGPDPDGVIPPQHVQRLKEVGQWLKKNGESIYSTRPGPFEPIDDYYGATQKGNKIYIQQLKLHKGQTEIKLPSVNKRITSCKILGGPKVKFVQQQDGITLDIDTTKLNPVVTTFALQTN
jgi:alpha-L-fucosidase